MTWTNQTRNTSSFTNQTRNTSTFTNQAKSDATTFGELDNSFIGTLSNDDNFQGRPLGTWENDDPCSSTNWTNEVRH